MEDLKLGIYLEVKKGVIGTGHTAKSTEYRNLWMTLIVKDDEVICAHLDNDFKPTGLKQSMTIAEFTSGRFTYIPQGDKRYQAMMNALKESAKKKMEQKKAQAASAPAKQEKKKANWWDSSKQDDIKPGDIFKRPERGKESAKKKSSTEQVTKKNWWEK